MTCFAVLVLYRWRKFQGFFQFGESPSFRSLFGTLSLDQRPVFLDNIFPLGINLSNLTEFGL